MFKKAAFPLLLALCLAVFLSGCAADDIPLNGGGSDSTVTELTDSAITTGGTYSVSGNITETITVDAGTSNVTLILNGVSVTSDSSSAIFIKSAGSVNIRLADGTVNTLSDGKAYNLKLDGITPDACIFSKADLKIEGSGALIVNGNYKHGIVSKDDLVIDNGTIEINAVKSGLEGKDYIEINGGNIIINAGTDGIRTTNDEDANKGSISVNGGTIEISSGDDAVHAESDLTIKDGSLTVVQSHEGLEAVNVLITGGILSVTAEDDGINATDGGSIVISGGMVYVDCAGDGIDSNGNIEISGGTLLVNGPASGESTSVDHDGSFTVTGGTILAIGASGMIDGVDSVKDQVLISAFIAGHKGDKISVTDASGKEIVSMTAERDFGHMFISDPSMQEGNTYTIIFNGTAAANVEAGNSITIYGKSN